MKTSLILIVFSFFATSVLAQMSSCPDGQMNCSQCPMMSQWHDPCQKSDMKACHMMKAHCCSTNSSIQSVPDTCGMYGNLKGHSGMMRVMGPFYCLDSTNFSVRPTRTPPFICGMRDTVWMEICCHLRDGKLHRTTVYYGTDQGTVSFDVTVQVPGTSSVEASKIPTITMEVRPNPTKDRAVISLSEALVSPTIIEIVDQKGNVLRTYGVNGAREITIVTQNFPVGIYHLLLRSNNGTLLSSENLVVMR